MEERRECNVQRTKEKEEEYALALYSQSQVAHLGFTDVAAEGRVP